jgi:hypothetical protein
MLPETTTTQDETPDQRETTEGGEAVEIDPQEADNIEQMRGFARNLATDAAEGDDLREERADHFIRTTTMLSDEGFEQGVWIGQFEYDVAEICDYDTPPINWEPPFLSGVFMMPPMMYVVQGSNGLICPKEPTVIEGNLNKIRRKFLRFMTSEMGATPEEALRLTDNELLENRYLWHVAERTRGADDPREPPRSEGFLAKLERCAKMIAIEAILYSEEEVRIFMNTLGAEGNVEGDPQALQDQPETKSAEISEGEVEGGSTSPKLKRGPSGAINLRRNATDHERFGEEQHNQQVREHNTRQGGGTARLPENGGTPTSEHTAGTQAGCGAQGPVPPTPTPDTQARESAGGNKRKFPANRPTTCPTEISTDDTTNGSADNSNTEPRLGVSIEAVGTDRCDVIFTDGVTVSAIRTNGSGDAGGEGSESDKEKMFRILNLPGIFQRTTAHR